MDALGSPVQSGDSATHTVLAQVVRSRHSYDFTCVCDQTLWLTCPCNPFVHYHQWTERTVVTMKIVITSLGAEHMPRPSRAVDYKSMGNKELLNLVIQVQRGSVRDQGKIAQILGEAEARGLIQGQPEPSE